jgi:hypothetical protein
MMPKNPRNVENSWAKPRFIPSLSEVATLGLLASLFTGCSRHSPDTATAASEAPSPRLSPQEAKGVQQTLDSMAQVETRPMSLEEFAQAIQGQAGTNADNLSESERKRLLACLKQFYACYSTGDYEAYRRFRLRAPFTISQGLAEAVKKAALKTGLELKSDEDILHSAWGQWNGTNKIGQVSPEHILLSVVELQDVGQGLHAPSVGQLQRGGFSYWDGAVVYQPTLPDILEKNGRRRFFRLELLVRFNALASGPAAPLVLVGYWDPTREDWMPDALSTTFSVGHYDTLF